MSIHLFKELEFLKKTILALGAMVEDNLHNAIASVSNLDLKLAKQVSNKDLQIDAKEVEIEEECLKLLALYQPVAADLRFIIAVLKINNDLERIGDQAVNISHKVKSLSGNGDFSSAVDFKQMLSSAKKMLKQALDSLVNMDAGLAREVCVMDDDVDKMKREIKVDVLGRMLGSYAQISGFYALIGVARNLERIADLATNIAEDVIYMIEGNIIRHREREDQI